ncbi:MAG: hypothetical protein QOF89_5698 [Acidobacteriota bacterium]|jgi:hypothetical protein|nr:hypothetical protein [Acidobacteriota bacterium]
MKLISAVLTSVVLTVLLAAPAAHAQATRTWVSGVGDDVNPCSRTAPCKTFAGAISKTAAGGEISVLDPGGFGVVTITKAITINGDGTLAGILSAGTNGVIVNAGVNDVVTLRNISINGIGTGINGIRYLAGKSLVVDNVTISGFTTRGIDVSLTAAGTLYVKDTHINRGATGVFVSTTSASVLAVLDHVTLEGLTTGVDAAANGRVTISNSVLSNNAANGMIASVGSAIINADGNEMAFNNTAGVNCGASGAAIRLANNGIYNNSSGITIAAGCTVNSAGNNRDFGNSGTTNPNGGAVVVH